jgi:hypothetical protein
MFISKTLKPDMQEFLVEKTLKKHPKTIIFNEDNYFDSKLFYTQKFNTNLGIEILDGVNPFGEKTINNYFGWMINSHMPISDFFLVLSKTNKKTTKNILSKNAEYIVNNWTAVSLSLNSLLNLIDIQSIRDSFQSGKGIRPDFYSDKILLEKILDKVIFNINLINNINIILSEKSISFIVLHKFLTYNNLKKIFEMIESLLEITEELEKQDSHPILLLMLVKNLWNIISSIFIRLIKTPYNKIFSFYFQTKVFGFENPVNYQASLRFFLLNLFHKYIISNKKITLEKIKKYSIALHSLILTLTYCTINSYNEQKSINAAKSIDNTIIDKVDDDNAMKEIKDLDLSNTLIISQGFKDNDLIRLIYISDKDNENNIPFRVKEEEYNELFKSLYNEFFNDDYDTSRIQQQRKLNLLYKLYEIINPGDNMFDFIRKVIIL